MIALALAVFFLVSIAVCVPWTRAAVIAWFLSALLLAATDLMVRPPYVLRLAVVLLCATWLLIILFPARSPFGPLSRAERACQAVVLGVSAGARAAYQANTLAAQRATFIAELDALDPPNELWRAVKTAQLLDLRADPPQVGIGDATVRLVPWPWQVALDRRLVPLHRWLDDAIRARRLRRHPRPGFDEMTSVMRYDYFFLRILEARLEEVKTREGGLPRWHEEAAALMALGGEVRAPNASWTRLRDLVLEAYGLELRGATTDLSTAEQERLAIAADEARHAWVDLEQRDARGLASTR